MSDLVSLQTTTVVDGERSISAADVALFVLVACVFVVIALRVERFYLRQAEADRESREDNGGEP